MKKILTGLGLSAIAFVLIATPAFAAVNNGSFEAGNLTDPLFTTLTAVDNTNIDGWIVGSGNIDYIGNYWTASNGAQSLDLNGYTQGSISQKLATVTGATYKVTFDLSGNPASPSDTTDPYYSPSAKVVAVSANGIHPLNFNYDTSVKQNTLTDMKWENNSYSFVATGTSTKLNFASQIPGAYGPALDNVTITEILPGNANECKKGGWESFGVFRNQGDCVSFVATGGKNLPAVQ